MKKRDSLQFSINPYGLVRALLADPSTAEDVIRAIADGPAEKMTEKLGFLNLGEQNAPQEWYTLFPGTDRTKNAGEAGLFMRSGKTNFPLMRFKRQLERPASQQQPLPMNEVIPVAAEAVPANQVTRADIDAVIKKFGITEEQFMKISAGAYVPEEQAAAAAPVVEKAPEDVLPEHIAAIITRR
jgi:hypothetical protein